MSEEIENAAVNVPRAIFTTMIVNGALGFGMMVAILFCIGDIEDVLVGTSCFRVKMQEMTVWVRIGIADWFPLHSNILQQH